MLFNLKVPSTIRTSKLSSNSKENVEAKIPKLLKFHKNTKALCFNNGANVITQPNKWSLITEMLKYTK